MIKLKGRLIHFKSDSLFCYSCPDFFRLQSLQSICKFSGTVSKYEANIMLPPFEILRSIASIFNVSMDTLCGMKHQGTISTHGLNEAQTETLRLLIDAYRIKNSQIGKQPSQEQFAVLGKITAELTK